MRAGDQRGRGRRVKRDREPDRCGDAQGLAKEMPWTTKRPHLDGCWSPGP